jgi:hypothetical protein
VADGGMFSNLCDAKVSVKARMDGEAFVSDTTGDLTSCNPESFRTNGTYRISYRVTRESLSMESYSDAPYRLVLPVRTALAADMGYKASAELRIEDTVRHGNAFSPIGGFLMRYMTFLPDDGGKCAVSIQ